MVAQRLGRPAVGFELNKEHYIPAIEAGLRKAGPDLMASVVKYFPCDFWDLFEVVLVDPETGREQTLVPGKATAIREPSLA